MSTPRRILVAIALVLVGLSAALLLGGQAGMCLGPLGVTPVQCARVTGVVPSAGTGLPILALMIAIAAFVVAPPRPERGRSVLAGALVGGAIGAVAFLLFRPTTMEGLDSTGTWISIARPLDPSLLATAVVLGGLIGASAMRRGQGGPAGRRSGRD